MHAQPELQTGSSFHVGAIRCRLLVDGSFTYPSEWFFSNIAEARDELRSRGVSADQITTPYSCLLVEAGSKRVLIDTGAGPLAPTTGQLLSRLKESDIAASDIDVVILTHGHPDHIGGAVGRDGKPVFPNASYIMAESEWKFWTSEAIDYSQMAVPTEIKDLLLSTAKRMLPPLRPHVDLINGSTEVISGVHCVPAPGHTPGHLAVIITSGTEQLLYAADALLHPLQIEHPEWQSVFDFAPDQATDTRKKLLNRAAADDMLFMAYHFAMPKSWQSPDRGNYLDQGNSAEVKSHIRSPL